MLIGYPVSFSLAAVGLFFGFIAIKAGYFEFALMQALPERVFGILSNDTLLAIPFFTLMGAILERCGLAEDLLDGLGQLFGPVPRRAGLRGDRGRRDPRRHHRHRRRLGHRHGPDRAAGDDALRLRHEVRHRRDRVLRHHHAADPAVAGADRAGRPARPLGRRHVRRRLGPQPDPGPALLPVRVHRQHREAGVGAGHPARRAARCRAGRSSRSACGGSCPRWC